MKVIDLTKKIKTGMEIYPGDPEVNIKTVQRYPWKVSELNLGTHTGTHVDAFSHVKKEGKSIDDIPLTSFFGEAQLIGPDDKFPKGIGLFFTEKIDEDISDKIIESDPPFIGGEITEELERRLLNQGIVTYTDLVNLELIPKNETFTFYGLPLNIHHGDGSPVRAVALID